MVSPPGLVMEKNMRKINNCLLGLGLALVLVGCVMEDEQMLDDVRTAGDESALSGGPWTWKNTATLRCLDSNANGSVYTLNCNGGNFQLWTNTPLNFGDQIRNQATGRCLDSNTARQVYTLPCNGGAFQQWTVRNTGSFGWEIKNVATGFCLDSNASGSVYTLGCNGGNFQRWH